MPTPWTWPRGTSSALIKELHAGQGITLVEAARLLGVQVGGRPYKPELVLRWIKEGVSLPDGRFLRLEGVRLPRCWATSLGAWRRFRAAGVGLPAPNEQPAVSAPREVEEPKKAESDHEYIENFLDDLLQRKPLREIIMLLEIALTAARRRDEADTR
jgi:hypothetical protein